MIWYDMIWWLARPVANRSAPQITAALRDCGAARKRGRHTSSAEPFQGLHVPSDSGAEKVIFCVPPMHIGLPRTYVDKPKIARNGSSVRPFCKASLAIVNARVKYRK